jgi:hypothetical protein
MKGLELDDRSIFEYHEHIPTLKGLFYPILVLIGQIFLNFFSIGYAILTILAT